LTSLTLRSPAKINLGLWVGERRPDGYHDVVTIVVPLELCDTVVIRRVSSGINTRTSSGLAPSGPKNLAHRAAAAFFGATGAKAGCRIDIRKRIPVGGGLGGGSSNAATTLLGLNQLFGNPLSPAALRKTGATLGSDVPALMIGGPCVARGRGDRLRRIRLPRLAVLLHFPGYAVSTAWAYAELDRRRMTGPDLTLRRLSPTLLGLHLRRDESGKAAALIANSFEPVVFDRHPKLARVKHLLLEHGAYAASLSGSGSTVYGLAKTRSWKDPMAALALAGFPCVRTRTLGTGCDRRFRIS
jgi:4-diphosphocytidyl-2-C-methyl-D-erythritol kinase